VVTLDEEPCQLQQELKIGDLQIVFVALNMGAIWRQGCQMYVALCMLQAVIVAAQYDAEIECEGSHLDAKLK